MKAQASLEYTIVAMVLALAIIPASYLFVQYLERATSQVVGDQLDQIGRTIIVESEKLFYGISPGWHIINTHFPSGVQNIKVQSDWNAGFSELVFNATLKGLAAEFVFTTEVNLNASISDLDGITGTRSIFLESYQTRDDVPFVLMTLNKRCPASNDFDIDNDGDVDCFDMTAPGLSLNACHGEARPFDVWDGNWYNCLQADYDGNCSVSANAGSADLQIFRAQTGC